MVTPGYVHSFISGLEGTEEHPYMDRVSFRISNRIFVTINREMNRICIKLSPVDQDVFCLFDKDTIYAVPNGWGKHGWTLINLKKVKKTMLKDAVKWACFHVKNNKPVKRTKQN